MEGDGAAKIRTGNDATPENQDLSFLQTAVSAFLSEYGWLLLVLCVGVYLLIQHVRKNRSSGGQRSEPVGSQDTAVVARQHEALEAARMRMQAELDAKAAEFKEKQQRLEEEKRRQKIEMWESMKEGKSYKGSAKLAQSQSSDEASSSSTLPKPKTDKKTLRSSGYNPLSGEGGGTCSWRPGRRGPSSGG